MIWTIYCPTHFKTFPHFTELTLANGRTVLEPVNGGIPQRGNLSLHLEQVHRDVDALFPDPDYHGYAVIDWEVWYPWLILASKSLWVNESLSYVREAHPTWPQARIEQEAVRSWNETATAFMVETLRLCRSLRPRAFWGYYGRPGCYTGLDVASDPPACDASVQVRNDALHELWAAGSALFPSVYIGPNRKYPAERTPAFVEGEIGEALRLRAKFGLDSLPVVAFTWYDLFNGTNESNWRPMRNATDLSTEFVTPRRAGADGIIVWGAGEDASTAERCRTMTQFVNDTLGPVLRSVATNDSEPLQAAAPASAPRPHLVYMLADNIGYGGLGYLRAVSPAGPSAEVSTPTLDALAGSGAVLERLYTYEFCSPSRSSLLSGRLPQHVNIHNDDQTMPGAGIPAEMATMPSKLRGAGYRTHHLGKWHVGFSTPRHTPLGRGFVSSLGYIAGAYNGYLHAWSSGGSSGTPKGPSAATCAAFPGHVEYPSDGNGTLPGPTEGARCTAASVKARHLGWTTDLWLTANGTDGPARGLNASMDGEGFEEALFTRRAVALITDHSEEAKRAGEEGAPLFLYYAMHL